MFSKSLGKKLVVASVVMLLAACQSGPVHGPINATKIAQEKSDIWVDLTPYPKKASGDTDVLLGKSALVPSLDQAGFMGSQGQWAVYISDGTVRQALKRWADMAGWVFNDDFYEINVDIPLIAEAILLEKGPFKTAVQNLVEAVSLSEQPIRACFYDNNVLRIINVNQSCDIRSR